VPSRLSLELTLGEKKYAAHSEINDGWKVIKAKKWKYVSEMR
jgi:hypothetical protein